MCDFGCGTGHNMNLMAQAYPESTFIGYDIAEDAIASATAEAAEMGLTNVTFQIQDVTDVAGDVSFDLITAFDSIHDQVNPQGALNEASSHLAPGGAFMMVDVKASSNLEDNIDLPGGPVLLRREHASLHDRLARRGRRRSRHRLGRAIGGEDAQRRRATERPGLRLVQPVQQHLRLH